MKKMKMMMMLLLQVAMITVVVVHANPTCYEYWDAECATGTKNTYHALTGGNCSRSDEANPNALGTACLTTTLVALTQVEPNSCRKTFGSVQEVSQCVPYGRRNGRDLYMYCTAEGCDDFGDTCGADEITQPGQIKVWDACGDNVPDYYVDPLPSDGACYALPDKGASVRITCLNNLYMQAQIYHDLACEQLSPFNQAPTFLMAGGFDQCYPFQGATSDFALKVQSPCRCGLEQTTAPTPDEYGEDVLRFDLMYNLTVNGSNCLEGTRLSDFQSKVEEESRRNVVIEISNAILYSQQGIKWWFMSMAVRFLAIPQPLIIDFQEEMDRFFDDGRLLGIIQDTCGYQINITLNSTGSTVWDHDATQAPTTPPSAATTICYGSYTLGLWILGLSWGWGAFVSTFL